MNFFMKEIDDEIDDIVYVIITDNSHNEGIKLSVAMIKRYHNNRLSVRIEVPTYYEGNRLTE